jgi:DNA invertase Pin-like site-specific DNA recombinase
MNKRAVVWVAVSSQRQADDDKISLAYQEEKARAWCAANGCEVVEVLKVEGHSRSDPNLIRLLELYEKKGVTAYARLQELWACKGFDVLVAYSSDRLGRSGTLIHWVIETTYFEGMQICLTDGGGLMDPANYRMQALLGTAQSTMPMDAFKDKTRETKLKLAAAGLSTGRYPLSHLPVRDPVSGKPVEVIVNEANRPLYEAIATLLLEGLPWNKMGEALSQRYGHLTGADTFYHGKNIRRMFLIPWVFGNSVVRHNRGPENWMNGRWIFDADVAPPPDVVVYYDVVPPVFEGERLEQIKAELRRRFEIKGRGSTRDAHRFSRLCLCDECGYLMSVMTKVVDGVRRRNGYVCGHSGVGMPPDKRCSNSRHIHKSVIQAFVEAQLARYLRTAASPTLEAVTPPVSELAALTQQIARVTGQLNRAIDLQLETDDPALQARYRDRVKELNSETQRLENQRKDLQKRAAAQQRAVEAQTHTIEFIKHIGLEQFWQLPDPQINQWLLRFFGDLRISIRDKEVVGLKRRTTKGWT